MSVPLCSLGCSIICESAAYNMFGSRGGGGQGPDPLENHKNIGFLSNTGPGSLKITKLQIQHSVLGDHRPARETPFKWRFTGGPLTAR